VRTTRHSMIIVAVLAALAIPLGTEVARGASDDDGPTCSAASLQGAYGLTGQGYLGRVPLAFVGVAVFDGKGHFRGHHDENIGGNIGTATDAGPYQVEGDCHGTIDFDDHHHSNLPDHTHRAKIVVADGGREVMLLGTDTTPKGMGYHEESPDLELIFNATLKKL
jgi:hypothetical protein